MTVGAANGHLERRNQDVDRVRISEIDQFDYPSPMIFVEVSDKEFCLCIDYWHLNAKAISEFIIFPSIEEVAMIIITIPITTVINITTKHFQKPLTKELQRYVIFLKLYCKLSLKILHLGSLMTPSISVN